MIKLRFNWMDVFSAARLGFNGKKIQIGTIGVFLCTVIYSLLTYGAFWASKTKPIEVWRTFKFIPIPHPFNIINFNVWGWIIWAVGILAVFWILSVTLTAISKTTYEQLRGDDFYEVREAFKFGIKYWKGSFLAPITLIIFIAIIIGLGVLWGWWIGRIPYGGQILTAIFSPFLFAAALFVIYLSVIFFVSLIISPAVVATTKSDTFDTLFENFSIINTQTWRFALWEFIVKATTCIGTFIFGFFLKNSLTVMHRALGILQGPRQYIETMWNNARFFLPPVPAFPFTHVDDFFARFLPVMLQPHNLLMGSWGDKVGGFLLGLFFYILGFLVIGFALSMWSAGQTVIYTVIVKMKDEKNLLEQKEELFEEELEEENLDVSVEKPAPEEKKGENLKEKKTSEDAEEGKKE
ncbi:hypothetical protein KAU34_05665 [candidate division WOR-3 bacterium]|nr:hypothetical protein [candidate division WOR-3 bacterium]MCK4575873.1 hypothetical protein [candidate division WOR-3 bacterium]